jgi:hypothetical protein
MTEQEFQARILKNFPDLFTRDENDEPYCPCGIHIPTPWQIIVEGLMIVINDYAQYQNKRKKRKKRIFPIYSLCRLGCKVFHLMSDVASTDKLWQKETKGQKRKTIKDLDEFRERHRIRESIYSFLITTSYSLDALSKKEDRTPYQFPRIAQIKEKFNELRVYFDDGEDEFIRGLIFYAQSAAKNIDPRGKSPVVIMPEDIEDCVLNDEGELEYAKISSQFRDFCRSQPKQNK